MNAALAEFGNQAFGADAQVFALSSERKRRSWFREVEIGLVVRRGRQQDALALVLLNILLDDLVAFALAVAQVVALVDDHDAEAAQVGQLVLHVGDA